MRRRLFLFVLLLSACGSPQNDVVEPDPLSNGAPHDEAAADTQAPLDPAVTPRAPCRVEEARDFADFRAPRVFAHVGATTWLTKEQQLVRLTENGLGFENVIRVGEDPISSAMVGEGHLRLGLARSNRGQMVDVDFTGEIPALGEPWPVRSGVPEAFAVGGPWSYVVVRRPNAGLHLELFHRERPVASQDLGSTMVPLDIACEGERCEAYVLGPTTVRRYVSDGEPALSEQTIRESAGVRALEILGQGRVLWVLSTRDGIAVAESLADGSNATVRDLPGRADHVELLRSGGRLFLVAFRGQGWIVARVHPELGPVESLPFDGFARIQATSVDDGLLVFGLDDDAPRARGVLVGHDGRVSGAFELGGEDQPEERRWLNARVARRDGTTSVLLSTSLGDGGARIVRLGGCR